MTHTICNDTNTKIGWVSSLIAPMKCDQLRFFIKVMGRLSSIGSPLCGLARAMSTLRRLALERG